MNRPRILRVRECARLAGVTVKALHHYERRGLLAPARTDAGHRLYTSRDVRRLDEILALKFVGLPLDQIKRVLDSDAGSLLDALREQRQQLKKERRHLDRAIRAIRQAERRLSDNCELPVVAPDASILAMLIEAIEMDSELDVMRPYFSDATWPKARDYFAAWPSAAWRTLLRDVHDALDGGPSTATARALTARWNALFMADGAGDGAFRAGLWKAWRNYGHWPSALIRRVAPLDLKRIVRFIDEAAWSQVDSDGRIDAAGRSRAPDRVSPTKIALFHEIASALKDDPASARARLLVARWEAIVEDETGGDEDMRASMRKQLQSRQSWPAGMQRYVGSLYDMDFDTWSRVAAFIEQQSGRVASLRTTRSDGSASCV